MPAQLILGASNIQAVVKELRTLDRELYNTLRRELKAELSPVSKKIQSNIPSKAPLSGFAKRNATGPEGLRYTWQKPTAGVNTDLGNPKRAASGLTPLVSLFYRDKGGTAGFSILELAGSKNIGRFKNGLMAKKGFPLGDRGRWVIPQYYKMQPQVREKAIKILQKYGDKVSRRLSGGS